MKEEDALKARAVEWWVSKRPLVFTQAKHLENPTINTTTDAEKALAEAVAASVKILGRG